MGLISRLRSFRDAETLYMTEILDTMPVILLGLLAATVQSTLALRASSVFGSRRALRTAFICIMAFLIFMAWIANVGESMKGCARRLRIHLLT